MDTQFDRISLATTKKLVTKRVSMPLYFKVCLGPPHLLLFYAKSKQSISNSQQNFSSPAKKELLNAVEWTPKTSTQIHGKIGFVSFELHFKMIRILAYNLKNFDPDLWDRKWAVKGLISGLQIDMKLVKNGSVMYLKLTEIVPEWAF